MLCIQGTQAHYLHGFLESSISKVQFGFMKSHSTLQQLLHFYDSVFLAVSSGSPCDVVYLDFTKAFDTIPHNELLFKLLHIGVCGDLWWFRATECNASPWATQTWYLSFQEFPRRASLVLSFSSSTLTISLT